MNTRLLIALLWAGAAAAAAPAADPAAASPRWYGFNLLEKFTKEWSNGPFREDDFRLIARLGFNFVRLPMDYRTWIRDGNWTNFNEATLAEIDQAVAWGRQYGLHVSINFHRAPGYSVNEKPKEARDLWSDDEALRVCALHWATFARRYRGIPSAQLSFNLLNEPKDIDPAVHERVVRRLVGAIRAEDPGRLIMADARKWGSTPCPELAPLKILQATRGYSPHQLTHYRANWMHGSDTWDTPTWPQLQANGWLFGPGKKELKSPLVITGAIPAGARLRLRVGTVSARNRLLVRADGQPVLDRVFTPGSGTGEWKKVVFRPEWKTYQNVYDLDVTADLPAGARRLEMEAAEGDWMTLTQIGVRPAGGAEQVLPLLAEWQRQDGVIRYDAAVAGGPFVTPVIRGRAWLQSENVAPFQALEKLGVGVMVGEWGAYSKTPHEVTLRWMEDCLANWQAAGWGWALWNFRGAFGILDSGRADVAYEDLEGHKLDRRMLDLLLKYRPKVR